jgi:hypothetical protein
MKKQMPASQPAKSETDRAIDCIVRLLKDCERLTRDMNKSARSSASLQRREKSPAKRLGRSGKK